MSDQLFCIDLDAGTDAPHVQDDGHPSWRLDERTKRIGRDGIAAARAALAGAGTRYDHDQPLAA